MSVHNDLLNDEMKVLHEQSSGAPESAQMCSSWQDELEDMCSSWQDDTCRVRMCTTSDRYVKILDFRHFERFFRFDQSDRKTYKKAVSDGVNVSVVIDMVTGNI